MARERWYDDDRDDDRRHERRSWRGRDHDAQGRGYDPYEQNLEREEGSPHHTANFGIPGALGRGGSQYHGGGAFGSRGLEDVEPRPDRHHRGRGPRGYTRSDERINEDVHDRLTEDWMLDASDIEVSVSGGEVTLNGMVESRQDKRRAEDIVEDISGVTHVQNNLRVRPQNEGSHGITTG